MSIVEKQEHIVGCVRNSVQSVDEISGNWHMKFSVLIDGKPYNLCRQSFSALMDISERGLQRIISQVKAGAFKNIKKIGDATAIEIDHNPKSLKEFAQSFGLELTDKQVSSIKIPPTSTKAKALVQWIDAFVTVAACVNPTDGKLQVELCGLDEMYLMYVNDFSQIRKEEYLKKTRFRNIFLDVFSFVQIRKKKSVTGKCQICAILSFLRTKAKSMAEIESVSKLHAIHKMGFMGERNSYYERRAKGSLPGYLSLITDGMAQMHCILPWLKGKAQPTNIKQHLQGTFVHGKGIYIYRSFNNVKVR